MSSAPEAGPARRPGKAATDPCDALRNESREVTRKRYVRVAASRAPSTESASRSFNLSAGRSISK